VGRKGVEQLLAVVTNANDKRVPEVARACLAALGAQNIRTLLLKNELREGTPAFGIAIQVVRQGLRSLSWKQRFIYLEEMVPLLRRHGLTSGREWD
jgi:hypothetical protein